MRRSLFKFDLNTHTNTTKTTKNKSIETAQFIELEASPLKTTQIKIEQSENVHTSIFSHFQDQFKSFRNLQNVMAF